MWRFLIITAGLLVLMSTTICHSQKADVALVKISSAPMHDGRISPMLYGGFIELLEDLVPGMWAEMLNDRDFEGTGVPAGWCYFTGAPTACDRSWDINESWEIDKKNPFNGTASVKLESQNGKPASLTQSGLGTRKGMTYHLSGYVRADSPSLKSTIMLKFLNPDGTWMTLGSASLPSVGKKWSKVEIVITSTGTTDRAVFELKVDGSGNLWADKLSLMPTDNINGWRKDVVEVIKGSHPSIIRWGGSLIDPGGYRWKEGIGDRDKRKQFANRVWGRNDSNDVGIDEFLQFCEAVDAEPLVCICLSDGPQSARDLVEYCNGPVDSLWGRKRAENGHPNPYNVKYWQLGNELGGDEYSTTCIDFCKGIKEVDPNALIMSSFPSPELFQKVGQYLSYTCPHHYTPNLEECKTNIDEVYKTLKQSSLDSKIKLGITEWNWTAGAWGLGRANLMTLECAIHNARYLNLLHRNSDKVEIACRSNMTNSYGSGMIETNQTGVLKRPSYFTMKLYSDHTKPVPLVVEGVPEYLDITACRSDDGRQLCVFAVNTKDEPVRIRLDLSDYGGRLLPVNGETVCDTLDRRQPMLMNHWTAPERIKTVKLALDGETIVLPAFSISAIECSEGR